MMKVNEQREQIIEIYGMLNRILWQIESSDHYNYIPGTKTDGWDHYEAELSKVEETMQRLLLGEEAILDKLRRIVREVRRFVKSFEVPGVVDRWLEIDPALKYFDVVFDAIENCPESVSVK